MYRELWKKCHSSVCRIKLYNSKQIRILSLTGFKTGNYIVTDEMLLNFHQTREVEIHFVGEDSNSTAGKISIPVEDFRKRIVPRPKSIYNRILLIRADIPALEQIRGLPLSAKEPEIGQPLAVLGFQNDQENLCLKTGILSSFYFRKGSPYLQFEASVKQGNSGSPLIDAETGEVIGVVGHRLAELSKSYNRIRDIVDENVEILETVLDKWKIDGIDPVQVLIANQNLVKHFAKEIYQSANVRIGFATPVSEIHQYLQKVNSHTRQLKG